MSSWLWQVQGSVLPGLNVGERVDWGPFLRLGRRVFLQLPGVVLHSSWLVFGGCISPSCLDHFHSFLRVGLGYL